jgi:hypothetical protein
MLSVFLSIQVATLSFFYTTELSIFKNMCRYNDISYAKLLLAYSVQCIQSIIFFLLPAQVSELSITGRDQTGYTVYAGYCMFPQSCDLRTETAGS